MIESISMNSFIDCPKCKKVHVYFLDADGRFIENTEYTKTGAGYYVTLVTENGHLGVLCKRANNEV